MPTLKTNGIDLYYETHGEGKPLVLIAGLACDCLMWTPFLDTFKKHWKVVILDNRGVGRTTSPTRAYTIEDMAKDTVALLDHLDLSDVHLFGHSMGGCIAQVITHKNPEKVEKLVLCCTSSKFNKVSEFSEKSFLALRQQNVPIELVIDTVLPWLYSSHFLKDNRSVAFIKKMLLEAPYPQSVEGFKGQTEALAKFDSHSWVSKISTPTLIMSGEEDVLCLKDAKMLQGEIKNARSVVFAECGHIPFAEYPQKFVQALSDFLLE